MGRYTPFMAFVVLLLCLPRIDLLAQRIQFSTPPASGSGTFTPGTTNPNIPPLSNPPVTGGVSGGFDAFSNPQIPNLTGQTGAPPAFAGPGVTRGGIGQTPSNQIPVFQNPATSAPSTNNSPFAKQFPFNSGAAQIQPNNQFPQNNSTPPLFNPNANGNGQSFNDFIKQSDWPKLFHSFRIRDTWVNGGDPDKVEINDFEFATSINFPNWLGTGMPLTVSPGAIFHSWQGPNTAITGNDLPSSAYSAFLSFGHSTSLNKPFGAEGQATVGVYSGFNTFTTDSLRLTGSGLLWYRMSPTMTLKFGAEYLDRIDLKLLPAGGLFITPNENLRMNLFFPRPKISRRIPNIGNTEVWAYVAAEYGGGSWTIRRTAGFSDQVDLNDYRATVGLEWIGVRGVTGFAEVGYVFQRELIYRSTDPLDAELGDTFMFRAGFSL